MKTTPHGFTLIELMITVAIIGILAAIGIPAYQNYVMRAKLVEVFTLTRTAKLTVTEHFTVNGAWPVDNAEAGLPSALDFNSKYVRAVSVVYNRVMVVFGTGADVPAPIRNKTLFLTAGANANGAIAWQCGDKPAPFWPSGGPVPFEGPGGGGTLESKYRPSECRA